jgi:hypothetical protein
MRSTFILALMLVGCSGQPFTASMIGSVSDGGDQVETDGSGGSASTETGGAAESGGRAGTGGHVGVGSGGHFETGGSSSTGGRSTTGGSTSTGGVNSSSGGSSGATGSTGGSFATGGASSSTGGTPSDACVLVTHDNGIGQTWQDCVPLDTYNATQATAACEAYKAAHVASCSSARCVLALGSCISIGSNSVEYTADCGGGAILWTYAPGTANPTGGGHVVNITTASSPDGCPTSQDPSWD